MYVFPEKILFREVNSRKETKNRRSLNWLKNGENILNL